MSFLNALKLTNNWQQAILDSTDLTIISTDIQGIIRAFNVGALRKLGFNAEELIGKATPERLHDHEEIIKRAAHLSRELGRPVAANFEALVAKARLGMPDQWEWSYLRKQGGRFPVWLSVTALRDNKGQINGFVMIGHDISERKQLELALFAREKLYRDIVDNAYELIHSVGMDGQILYTNRLWQETLGYNEADLSRLSIYDVIPADQQSLVARMQQAAVQGHELNDVEFKLRGKDGREIVVQAKIRGLFKESKPVATRSLMRNITAQRQLESQVQAQAAEIEMLRTSLRQRS